MCSGLALLGPVAAQAASPTPDPSPAFAPQPDPFPSPAPVRPHAAAPVVRPTVTVVLPAPVAVAARPVAPPAARTKPAARPRPHRRAHHRHAVVRRAAVTPPLRIPDHAPPAFVATAVLGAAHRRVPLALVVALAVLTLASATLVARVARETAA
ncbi:MAG TPA: hypothetical protein VFL60_00165 [Gaiellaceae bacterium]|nr:hypothetical protein [Gaiellaceae bacterium]